MDPQRIQDVQDRVRPFLLPSLVGVMGVLVLFLFLQHVHQLTNLFVPIALFSTAFFLFYMMKEGHDERTVKTATLLLQAILFLALMSFIAHFTMSFAGWVEARTPGRGAPVVTVGLLIDMMILFSFFAFLRSDKWQENMTELASHNLYERLGLIKETVETGLGDVQLCINKDTKKPVVWRYKDRFLHMLILGPTGSGKTSQTIIPLLNQDVQNLDAGITVIEPKGDLAEKVYAMAEHYGRPAVYFNPILPNCPVFNPLFGKEEEVIENMATTFKMLNADSPQFFLDQNENLIRNSLKVLKRLLGNKATLIDLSTLIHNSGGQGRNMVRDFSRLKVETADIAKENADIASWFNGDYYKEKSKTYEHCSGLRSQVSKITSNKHLRRVLNPADGENDLDFDKHLAEGGIITISTAQGALRELGRYLGYFIILQFQSSVFRRPGNENTRRPHFLYIDEFQTYANPGFADMLTQGRSYRVASHLATQNRALIGMGSGRDGRSFIELVSTNARNVILYPGGNNDDAAYYSKQFGEVLVKSTQKGVTKQKFNPLKGIKPMNYDSESVREVEELKARFTASDLIYREFGEITYALIDNNTLQAPGIGQIEFIPRELNEKLDVMVAEFNERNMPEIDDEVAVDAPKKPSGNQNVEPVILLDDDDMVPDDLVVDLDEDLMASPGMFEDDVARGPEEDDFFSDDATSSKHHRFDELQDQDYRHMHQNDSPDSHDDDLI